MLFKRAYGYWKETILTEKDGIFSCKRLVIFIVTFSSLKKEKIIFKCL